MPFTDSLTWAHPKAIADFQYGESEARGLRVRRIGGAPGAARASGQAEPGGRAVRDGGLAARLDEWRIVLARQAVLARQ